MNVKNKNILFLSPHPDDVELHCSGLIQLLQPANKVYILTISNCKESIPKELDENIILQEYSNVMNFINPFFYEMLDFPVRRFNENRQVILEYFVAINKATHFDYVFFPPENDFHQDHKTIYNESIRAFQKSNLVTYDTFNTQEKEWNYIINIPEDIMERKLELISKYKSQFSKKYFDLDFIKANMMAIGKLANFKYAEIFKMKKIIQW